MYRTKNVSRLLAVAMIGVLPAPLSGCGALLLMDEMLFGPSGAATAPTSPAPGVYADAPPATRSPVSVSDRSSCALDEEAWTMLATEQDARALATFGEEIDLHPADGLPVAGYALTAAIMGDLGCGTSTMRWVLRHDPGALDRVPVSPGLRHRLESLATSYHQCVLSVDLDRPTLQMLGALYYLMGDLDSARSAATLSRRLGDRSVVVENLVTLLDAASVANQTPSPSSHATSDASRTPPVSVEPAREQPRIGSAAPAARSAHADEASITPSPAVRDEVPPSPSSSAPPAVTTPPDAAGEEVAPVVIEPVDYDRLRDELLEMSDTLDRFTRKLLGAIEEGGLSDGAASRSSNGELPVP